MNKYMFATLLLVGVVSVPGISRAVEEVAAPTKAVEVGNKVCPVSGEKIEEGAMGGPVKVEHNGKIYNLCCSMCKGDFIKNPEKFSKIADEEVSKDQAK
jgi:YHS domain-containing protein